MLTHSKTTAVGLIPADVRAATYTTADFDVSPYVGQGKFILDAEAQGSGITNNVKLQHSSIANGASDVTVNDAALALNKSTGGKTSLAVKFTQAGIRQIKHIDLILKKVGTIAADKILTVTLQANASTVPSGTPLATAVTVLANGIDDAYQTVRFTLATPYQLADSTVYWITLESNYTASDTNYIDWSISTVVSGGTVATFAAATWTAVTTQLANFTLRELAFADVTSGAFTEVGNAAALQSLGLELDSLGSHIRAVATVAGGSSTGAYSLVLVAPTQNQ